MEQLALGYCFNRKDLFKNFPVKKMILKSKDYDRLFKGSHTREASAEIFIYALYIILLDIIHNGITFKLPTTKEAYIYIESTSGEDFKRARRNGAWRDVDYLKSNFTGNSLKYMRIFRGREIKKSIYVGKELKDLITKYTNEGRGYA